MALKELLAAGAGALARGLIDLGWIAPNIIRRLIQKEPGHKYRSYRAVVSRAYQAVRAAKEAKSFGRILKGSVPLEPVPDKTPYRGAGQGCFEARIRFLVPGRYQEAGQWKTRFVNFDTGLTFQELKDLAKRTVRATITFTPTGGESLTDREFADLHVEIDQITRRC